MEQCSNVSGRRVKALRRPEAGQWSIRVEASALPPPKSSEAAPPALSSTEQSSRVTSMAVPLTTIPPPRESWPSVSTSPTRMNVPAVAVMTRLELEPLRIALRELAAFKVIVFPGALSERGIVPM